MVITAHSFSPHNFCMKTAGIIFVCMKLLLYASIITSAWKLLESLLYAWNCCSNAPWMKLFIDVSWINSAWSCSLCLHDKFCMTDWLDDSFMGWQLWWTAWAENGWQRIWQHGQKLDGSEAYNLAGNWLEVRRATWLWQLTNGWLWPLTECWLLPLTSTIDRVLTVGRTLTLTIDRGWLWPLTGSWLWPLTMVDFDHWPSVDLDHWLVIEVLGRLVGCFSEWAGGLLNCDQKWYSGPIWVIFTHGTNIAVPCISGILVGVLL